MGGEDKCVTVWECHGKFKRLLKLTRSRDINSLAFSKDMVAVAAGSRVVITGGCGGHQYSWRDRPDFEHMADLLDGDAVALSVVLERFPSATNLCHPHSGESLMQRAVRLHTNDVLYKVLSVSGSKIGFVQDKNRRTALLMALLLEKRDATAMLVETVASGRVSTMPSSLAAVTECFSLMCKVFPGLLLDLICQTPLEKEPEMIAQDGAASGSQAVFARLTDGENIVRGSSKQTGPSWLWTDVCDDLEATGGGSMEVGSSAGNGAGTLAPASAAEGVYRKYATKRNVSDLISPSASQQQPVDVPLSSRMLFRENQATLDLKSNPHARRRFSESFEATLAASVEAAIIATASPKAARGDPAGSSLDSLNEEKAVEPHNQGKDSGSEWQPSSAMVEIKPRQVCEIRNIFTKEVLFLYCPTALDLLSPPSPYIVVYSLLRTSYHLKVVAVYDAQTKSWRSIRKRASNVRMLLFWGASSNYEKGLSILHTGLGKSVS
jgi:hypothetical protein